MMGNESIEVIRLTRFILGGMRTHLVHPSESQFGEHAIGRTISLQAPNLLVNVVLGV